MEGLKAEDKKKLLKAFGAARKFARGSSGSGSPPEKPLTSHESNIAVRGTKRETGEHLALVPPEKPPSGGSGDDWNGREREEADEKYFQEQKAELISDWESDVLRGYYNDFLIKFDQVMQGKNDLLKEAAKEALSSEQLFEAINDYMERQVDECTNSVSRDGCHSIYRLLSWLAGIDYPHLDKVKKMKDFQRAVEKSYEDEIVQIMDRGGDEEFARYAEIFATQFGVSELAKRQAFKVAREQKEKRRQAEEFRHSLFGRINRFFNRFF